ncbi:MAG: hypothetical protein ABI891_09480, partial [Acidobacteriota bacterium]
RKDFPGGWREDKINKFTKEGRTADEQEMFKWTSRWIETRKQNEALREGRTIDVYYDENIYAFRRKKDENDILFIFNSSDKKQSVSFDRKLINAVGKSCYIDILVDFYDKKPLGGRCPDYGSDKVDFELEPTSVTAVEFGNLTAPTITN